jgi:hypothetical protein
MFIQAGQALAGLEIFLDGPPQPGDLDQRSQGHVLGCVAAVEKEFPGAGWRRISSQRKPAWPLAMAAQAQS